MGLCGRFCVEHDFWGAIVRVSIGVLMVISCGRMM